MFGIFKKKAKIKKQSELEKLIERDGFEFAAKGCAQVLIEKLPTYEIAYQFILEEIEAASLGDDESIRFSRDTGISQNEYRGSMNNSRPEVDGPGGPQQLMLGLCMQLHPDMHLVVKFRILIVDNIMRHFSLGKYNLHTRQPIVDLADENSDRWVALLTNIDHKDAVAFLSRKIPLTFQLLKKYEDYWDWNGENGLSSSNSIVWSLEVIEYFESRWDWEQLSQNNTIPWSGKLIKKFENCWDWDALSSNQSLPWSIVLITEFEENWSWNDLSTNEALPWTKGLIEKFKDKWWWGIEYGGLSNNKALPWSLSLVESFKDRWCWSWGIPQNQHLMQTPQLFNEYLKLGNWIDSSKQLNIGDWDNLSTNEFLENFKASIEQIKNNEYYDVVWGNLSSNESLPWTEQFIESFESFWKWGAFGLSRNISLPWAPEFIERYKDRWDWGALSENEALPWSLVLLERYNEYWDWNALSKNESLPWTKELIELYKEQWDWSALSRNGALPWSKELLKNYKNNWDWGEISCWNTQLPWSIELINSFENYLRWDGEYGGLSRNQSLPWSAEFLEYYEFFWDGEWVSGNEKLPWSLELLERFTDRWNWEALGWNEKLPKFELTEQEIDIIMNDNNNSIF